MKEKKRLEVIQNANMILYPDFYSMIIPKKKAKRKCPRCRQLKISLDPGDRYCGGCKLVAEKVGHAGTYVVECL